MDTIDPRRNPRVADAALPFATQRELSVAGVRLRALRITYVGELGFELHVATELAGGRLPGTTPGELPTDFEAWAGEVLLRPEALPVDESLTASEQMAFFLSSPAFHRQ